MASSRYLQLRKQIDVLRQALLPAAFDLTGVYSDDVLTRALAFRVLAHAEIESFLEGRAWEAVNTALIAWKERRRAGRTLLALLAFNSAHGGEPPKSLGAPQPSQQRSWPDQVDLDKRVKNAATAYRRILEANHGVKEANIMPLLIPIGFNIEALDQALLNDLTAFGEARGDGAHRSSSLQTAPDPKTEWMRVEALVSGLDDIDREMSTLVAELTEPPAAVPSEAVVAALRDSNVSTPGLASSAASPGGAEPTPDVLGAATLLPSSR